MKKLRLTRLRSIFWWHNALVDADRSFERIYRRHRREVYGSVLRDVRDPDEAEDVTQAAFLNAFRAMRRGDAPEKPRAWLLTIARNVVRRRARLRAERPQEVELDSELLLTLDDDEGSASEDIHAALLRLTDAQREAILLREIQGRSYAEISFELGLSLAAVEALIFRARRALAEELELVDRVPVVRPRRRLWPPRRFRASRRRRRSASPSAGSGSPASSAARCSGPGRSGTAPPRTSPPPWPRRARRTSSCPTSFPPRTRLTLPGRREKHKGGSPGSGKPAHEQAPSAGDESSKQDGGSLLPVELPPVELPPVELPVPLPSVEVPPPPPLPQVPDLPPLPSLTS